MKVSKKPLPGAVLQMDGGFTATLLGRWPEAHGPLYRFTAQQRPVCLMAQHGHVPLPPYITHTDSADDEQRYQTVFAKNPGAVAAPTAALHFDEAMLAQLEARGIAARQRHAACRRGHLPAGQDRNHRRAPHALRALRRAASHAARRLPPARRAAGAWWPWARRRVRALESCGASSARPAATPTSSSRRALSSRWSMCC